MDKKLGFFSACKLLWKIGSKKDKAIFIVLLFACIIRSFTFLLIPLITSCVISKLSGNSASILFIKFPDRLSNTAVILIAFAFLPVLQITATVLRALMKLFAYRMSNKTHIEALNYILEYRKNFNLNMTDGEASYIVKSASDQVFSFFEDFLIKIFTPIVIAVFSCIYIAVVNIYALLIILATLAIMNLSICYRIVMDNKINKILERISGKQNNHFLNNIENLPFIGFFKTREREYQILKELNDENYKNQKKKLNTYLIYWTFTHLIEYVSAIGVVLLVLSNKSMPMSEITSALIIIIPYLLDVYNKYEDLAFVMSNVQQYSIKISRLLLLKENPENIIEMGKILPKDEKVNKITIKNMDIEIGEFSKVVQEINLYKGQINCLAGGSGSGKSSLINCLLGLKEYKTGEIIINDKYQINSLFFENDRVALAFQEENLFDRNFQENVMYPDTQLNDKTKNLINDFSLQEIFDRNQTNESIKTTLSGGEKRRINLIRAFAKDAEIYIFDEPTNDLDGKNVEKVLSNLVKIKENSIVIVVSHDKRLVEISDNVIKF